MKKFSTAARITLWCVAILALGEIVFGAATWFLLRRDLYDLVDAQVQHQADDLQTALGVQNDAPSREAEADLVRKTIANTYAVDRSRDYLEVFTESGELVYRSHSLAGHESELMPASEVKRPLARTRRIEKRPYRFLFEKLKTPSGVFVVEIGTPADDAVNTLHRFHTHALILGPLILLVAAAGIYTISRKALSNERR
jgi:hypothetical protein